MALAESKFRAELDESHEFNGLGVVEAFDIGPLVKFFDTRGLAPLFA